MTVPEDLVRRAREGDAAALRELRASGYFERLRAEKDGVPLLFSQRGLWALHNMGAGETGAYNISGAYRLRGQLDRQALERAGAVLVERHEALRSRFAMNGAEPRQFITMAPPPFHLQEHDLSAERHDECAVRNRVQEIADRPFQLESPPLLRMHLFRLAEQDAILLLVMHHIIGDGWSVALLLRELVALYDEAGLSSLPTATDWRSHAERMNALCAGESFDRIRTWWQEQFRDLPEPVPLPTDRARPGQPSYRGACLAVPVPAETEASLERLAREHQAGPFAVFDTAIKVLLFRYTGATDLITTFPVAGRDTPGDEQRVGMHMRTLPLRLRIDGQMTFRECLQRERDALLDAFDHQPYSLDLLTESVAAGLSWAESPFARVMTVLQEAGQTLLRLPGLEISEFHTGHYPALFDLVFEYCPGPGPCLRIHYSVDLFDEERIGRAAQHLFRLLENAASQPDTPCLRLQLLDPHERQLVVTQFNAAAAADYGPEADLTLPDLVARRAAEHPDSPALVCDEATCSYADLMRHADRIAHALQALSGWQNEDRVCVLAGRSLQLPMAMLGVMRAGGCYVPIDPSYPAERIRFMLEDSDCRAVLADQEGRTVLPDALGLPVLDPQNCGVFDHPPTAGPAPETLAYMIYTSGSTGNPKGVLIEHCGAVNMALTMRESFHVTADDVVLQFASCSFDASIWDSFMALANGATLALISRETIADASSFADYLQRHRVTMATLPPSFVEALPPGTLRSLRWLMTAGEAARATSARRLQRQLRFVNGYGPTETSVCAAWHEVLSDEAIRSEIPVGRPMPNHSIYILDDNGEPCGIGIPGEICVGGIGVGRGYHNRPDLTARAFVDDPFRPGGRMYHTGDIGYWLSSGRIMFMGRRDSQVKIRGYRIEVGEVERALEQVPDIREAAVVVLKDAATGQKSLAGCYLSETPLPPEQIRQHMIRLLPEFMLPGLFRHMRQWPTTPNGKIDRRTLARLCADATPATVQEDRPLDPPQPGAELLIAEVWQAVLGCDRINRHDHFFSIGGDSIRAIQVVHALREKGLNCKAADLFSHPTIAGFAAHAQIGPAAAQADPPGEVMASPIQSWFLQIPQTPSARNRFNQSTLLRLVRSAPVKHVQQALDTLVKHHASLRLRLVDPQQQRWTIVAPADAAVPLRAVGIDDRHAVAALAEDEHAGLDLQNGPILRALLLTLRHEQYLLLTAHHASVDFVSWEILCADLAAALDAADRNQPAELPAVSTGWRQWIEGQTKAAESLESQIPYWLQQLPTPDEMLPLTADDLLERNRVTVAETLSSDLTARLRREGCAAHRCDWAEMLVALLAHAVTQTLSRSHACFAIEGHGRLTEIDGLNAERAVGWFTSLHPLRIPQISESGGIEQVCRTLRSAPNRGTSFGMLRTYSERGRQAFGSRPLPWLVYNYLGESGAAEANQWLELQTEAPGQPVAADYRHSFAVEAVARVDPHGRLMFELTGPRSQQNLLDRLTRCIQEGARALLAQSADRQIVSQFDYAGFANDSELERFLQTL